ncbi:MAG: archaeosortase/exosortase family protein, partial [Planctomycetes bacterium]|nr:archaeosortase/exosortase family protein [Planctomycetota bacterium]
MSALPGLRGHVGRALTLFVLVGALVWSYWPTLVELEWNWSTSPQYSHGYLVPLLGAGMLWWRRDGLRKVSPRTNWWGLGLLVLAGAMRLG